MSWLAGVGKLVGGLAKQALPKLVPKVLDVGKRLLMKIPVVKKGVKKVRKFLGYDTPAATQANPINNPAVDKAPSTQQQISELERFKGGISEVVNIFNQGKRDFGGIRQQLRTEFGDLRQGLKDGLRGAGGAFKDELNRAKQEGIDMLKQGARQGAQMAMGMAREAINKHLG